MKSFETQLAEGLHGLADSEPETTAPSAALLKRGRRARHGHLVTVVGSSLAVLAIAAAAVVIGAPNRSGPPVGDARATADMELVAALSKTKQTSFRVRVEQTLRYTAINGRSYTTVGAFDPVAVSGYMRQSSEGSDMGELRLVRGDLYSIHGKTWVQAGKSEWLPFDALGTVFDGELGSTADSEQLLDVLRTAGANVSKVGPRLFRFDVTVKAGTIGTYRVAGDVTLDSQSRVTKITYNGQLTLSQSPPVAFDGPKLFPIGKVTMEFSGYGEPVLVKPPDSKIGG
jgi:hypothetical protein